METIPELIADVEAEMAAYRSVLDEYERTLLEVERTLAESPLDDRSEATDDGRPARGVGAD